jgi:alcohol dehydrogenase/propanol-preferring alcohol dehydrogenase
MPNATAVQVPSKGADFETVSRAVPEPTAGQVRIKLEACGVCHGDVVCKLGFWPGITYPRVPGHENIGIIDAVGEGVEQFRVGQRVGSGWHAGHCGKCGACRRGLYMECAKGSINGIFNDGGYAEYMTVSEDAVVAIPETNWSAAELAPLMCAGVTVFNALRQSGARAGDVVAVQGIGGLGHLAVQFARKMGFRTIAISSGDSKRELSMQLGAHEYVDASASDAAKALQQLGGARAIIATAPNAQAISELVPGLGMDGKMVVVAAPPDKLAIDSMHLLSHRAGIMGWPGGTPADIEETVAFALLTDCKPMVETFPLKEANAAFKAMMESKVRFRGVLVP